MRTRKSVWIIPLALLCQPTAVVLAQEPKLTATTALPASQHGSPVGKWSGGAFVRAAVENPASVVLSAYDKVGIEIQRAVLNIEKASLVNIASDRFARSADGYFAVAGSAYTDDNRGSTFLAILPPQGGRQIVVRTSPYAATRIAFAADGVVWTAGRELEGGREVNPGHLMIRRYGRDGKLLGAALPRTSFASKAHPAVLSHLLASSDRVGWYSGVAGMYIEFSLDGQEMGRYPADVASPDGAAICPDNSVWLSSRASDADGAPLSWSLAALDRGTGKFAFRHGKQASPLYIFGCDGSTLATQGASGSKMIEWRAVP